MPQTSEAPPADAPDRAATGLLSWPPPGLGRVQGELLAALTVTGLGGIVVVAPLLWAVAAEQAPWSLGPWGGAWWFPAVTTGFGLLLLFAGFTLLFRVFVAGRKAVRGGHDRRTVWLAAADWRRDTGFLIQGARMYSELSPGTRRTIVSTRLWGARLFLFAALWLPVSFAVTVLLATRGWMTPGLMIALTLAPTLLAALGGVIALGYGRLHLTRTGRAWEKRPEVAEERRAQIADWRQDMESLPAEGRPALAPGGGGAFRLAPALVVGLFFVVLFPVTALLVAASVGPIVGGLAVPHYAGLQERGAAAEPLRTFRLDPDPAITPEAAGRAVHVLAHVGGSDVQELEASPERRYAEGWFPADAPAGFGPTTPPDILMERAVAGLDDAERAYLERVAAHPAHQEIALLARASGADLAGARWSDPLPGNAAYLELPMPRLRPLREGADAHLARAALQVDAGDAEGAAETVRAVISAGLLLTDEGPSLTDNVVGVMIAESGADALEALYRATGQEERATSIGWARESALRASALMAPVGGDRELSGQLRGFSAMVTAPNSLRGLRWEQYALVNTIAPCLNLHSVVFGPGEEHRRWQESARNLMVRYPSEEQLFDVVDRGWFGGRGGAEDRSWMARFLSFTLGGGDVRAGCTDLVDTAAREGF